MTDFNKTVFYCSALSQIMNNGRGKTRLPSVMLSETIQKLSELRQKYDPFATKYVDRHISRKKKIEEYEAQIVELEQLKDEDFLPGAAKTYISQLYAYLKYQKWGVPTGGIKPTIEKGVLLEKQSINLLSEIDGFPYEKNEQKLDDEHICGIPDIIQDNAVCDIKTSYDVNSFFPNLHKELSLDYWWQIQGYLKLTGYKSGIVAFCLLSLTETKIQEIVTDIMSKTDKYTESEIRQRFNYEEIPLNERCIKFLVNRDDAAIGLIPDRVSACRNYLTRLEDRRTELRIANYGLSSHEDMEIQDEDQE